MGRPALFIRHATARLVTSAGIHKLIATGLGIGYIRRGGGTVAAGLCCVVWYLSVPDQTYSGTYSVLLTGLLTGVGIWSATVVERQWGKDNYRVVIDEVAGMCLSLLFVPIYPKTLLAGLVLFRFFDILKPLGIRRLEKLDGGWGVMADDLLAGLYTNLVVQGALAFNVL